MTCNSRSKNRKASISTQKRELDVEHVNYHTSFKCHFILKDIRWTNLSVCIQRVEHRARGQEVPVPQVFRAALLEPELLRFGEHPVAFPTAGAMDVFTLPSECGAERSHCGGDPQRRELFHVLHHRRRSADR